MLPKNVVDQVKPLLRKKETDFPDKNAYRQLKDTILRIFGCRPEVHVERALARVLVGQPSNLARSLVNDLCKKELVGCDCCPAIIMALWKRQLSSQVKAGIAHCKFNANTFEEVLQLADNIWSSSAPPATVAAVQVEPLDETQPAIPYASNPEVAAVQRGGAGGRARGRGNRGGRGQGRGRGQGQGGRGKGPKHPDLPSGEWYGCSMHRRWGRGAHFCSEPASCPWKDIFTPKSATSNNSNK